VTETERTDQAVSVQLERLREATEGDSIDRIRAEAMSVVEQVGAAVAIRRERQRDQLARLSDRVQALRSQLETARKETECDPLTELPNRRAFDRYVSATVDFARLTGGTAILLFVDADHFKKVNDVHGHQAGDTALRFLADVFVRTFPRRGDFVARYGGEEFCIVLRDADPDWGERLADRVLEAVRRRPVKHEGTSFALTVSVGVASLRPSESAEEWLGRADRALYRAKASGRDRACLDDEACPGPHPQKQATQPAAQKSGGRFGSPWTGSEARQTSPVVLHPSPRSPR
jgi:diguanylate cyclase (GGDEF)-like protein